MNEDGNLSIEASLIMPILIFYIILIISVGVFIFKNSIKLFKSNTETIKQYQTETNDEFIIIGEGNNNII